MPLVGVFGRLVESPLGLFVIITLLQFQLNIGFDE